MHRRIARGVRCACLVWVAAVIGCAGLQPTPDKGGPAWTRLESDHFVLLSDLDAATARETIRAFERHIAFQSIPNQPRWFAEGLATYFQTASFDDEQRFVIGGAPRDLLQLLHRLRRVPAAELFTERCERSGCALLCELVVARALLSRHGDAFVKYQDALAEGLAHPAAWTRAFPELTPERVDDLLDQYYTEGRYDYYLRVVPQHAGRASNVNVLDTADVYALRAHLFSACPKCADEQQRAAEHLAGGVAPRPDQPARVGVEDRRSGPE